MSYCENGFVFWAFRRNINIFFHSIGCRHTRWRTDTHGGVRVSRESVFEVDGVPGTLLAYRDLLDLSADAERARLPVEITHGILEGSRELDFEDDDLRLRREVVLTLRST